MGQQWGILIAGATLIVTAALIVVRIRDDGRRGRAIGLAAGTVCGLVAGFFIIQSRMDVVPDAFEPWLAAGAIVLVSLGLIMLTWRRGMQE